MKIVRAESRKPETNLSPHWRWCQALFVLFLFSFPFQPLQTSFELFSIVRAQCSIITFARTMTKKNWERRRRRRRRQEASNTIDSAHSTDFNQRPFSVLEKFSFRGFYASFELHFYGVSGCWGMCRRIEIHEISLKSIKAVHEISICGTSSCECRSQIVHTLCCVDSNLFGSGWWMPLFMHF